VNTPPSRGPATEAIPHMPPLPMQVLVISKVYGESARWDGSAHISPNAAGRFRNGTILQSGLGAKCRKAFQGGF
jgi:hypothetical protein